MPSQINGILGGATNGLSRLAAALAGGDATEQGAYDNTLYKQSRIAAALAQIDAQRAQAAKHGAETAALERRPGMFEELASANAGVDVPNLRAFRQGLQTGTPGSVPMGPEAPDGSMGVGRAQFTPETSSAIVQALTRFAPLQVSSGDIKPDDWAQALSAFRDMDLGDAVLGGKYQPGQVGAAQAAVAGKPLYNSDSTGGVLDLFGGVLDASNPIAQATIAERRAAADQHRASAAKSRAEIADGAGPGGKAPVGYRWAAGGTLEPIPGGPADPSTKGAKLNKPPTEGQAKALMFGSRMAIADEVLGELAGQGQRMPSLIKQGVEAVPLIGPALGMVANSTVASSAQQQVEQAQRDFINAVLRRESGAVISPQEFANARVQYFPQPGDSAAVLRQKQANRRAAISGMRAEFGDAMTPEFERIVGEARSGRGSDKPAAAGKPQRTVTVDY